MTFQQLIITDIIESNLTKLNSLFKDYSYESLYSIVKDSIMFFRDCKAAENEKIVNWSKLFDQIEFYSTSNPAIFWHAINSMDSHVRLFGTLIEGEGSIEKTSEGEINTSQFDFEINQEIVLGTYQNGKFFIYLYTPDMVFEIDRVIDDLGDYDENTILIDESKKEQFGEEPVIGIREAKKRQLPKRKVI